MRAKGIGPARQPATMKNHEHAPEKVAGTFPFSGPVAVGYDEDPRARGNICDVETCSCGATRKVNVNRGFREEGPWVAPSEAQAQGAR